MTKSVMTKLKLNTQNKKDVEIKDYIEDVFGVKCNYIGIGYFTVELYHDEINELRYCNLLSQEVCCEG